MRHVLIAVTLMLSPATAQPLPSPSPPSRLIPTVLWRVPLESSSFGGGAAADINGDGAIDVAFCTYFGDSKVRVISGRDGSPLWTHDAGGGKGAACLDASCRFTDLDGDGTLELIAPVSNTSQVLAFEGSSGKLRWTFEAGPGECIDSPPWIGRISGEPSPVIVVGTFKARLHVIRSADGTRARSVQIAPKGAVQSCPIVTDLNGDGHADFLATTFNGDGRIVAASGAIQEPPLADDRSARPVHELWHIKTDSPMLYHGPSVGDLDGDSKPDFAIGAYDGKVYAFHEDGSTLWTVKTPERYIMGPTVIADLDADGRPEVVVAGDHITTLRGRDGSVLWTVRFDKADKAWSVTRGVSVADLDGDGEPDLAALNGRGLFKAFRGRDGATLCEFESSTVHDRPMTACSHLPLIADLSGDGRVDVFYVIGGDMKDKHGLAIALTGFAGPAKNKDGSPNGWFMHRHDPHNTGNVGTKLEDALVRRLGTMP